MSHRSASPAPTPVSILAGLCLLSAASGCGGKSRFIDHSEPKSEPDGLMRFDDMEPDGSDEHEAFSWGNGGYGYWWTGSGVPTGLVDDVVPSREGSMRACHLAGQGSGSMVSAILNFPRFEPVGPFDERGLVFYARLESSGGTVVVAMSNWRAGTRPSRAFSVSPEWQRFELSFDELSPSWDGYASSIDFVVDEAVGPFDFWLDDVSFVCRGACPTYDDE